MLRRRSYQENVPTAKVIQTSERADYLPEFMGVGGGEVTLDRRTHTAGAQLFAGAKMTRTVVGMHCWYRETGDSYPRVGAAVADARLRGHFSARRPPGSQSAVGRFKGVPLESSRSVRQNVHLWGGGGECSPRSAAGATACLAVHAGVVLEDGVATLSYWEGTAGDISLNGSTSVSARRKRSSRVGSEGDSPATDPEFFCMG